MFTEKHTERLSLEGTDCLVQPYLLRAEAGCSGSCPAEFWIISKGRDSTARTSNLFLCFTIKYIYYIFFLMFKWNFLYFNMCPLCFVLPLGTTEKSGSVLFPTHHHRVTYTAIWKLQLGIAMRSLLSSKRMNVCLRGLPWKQVAVLLRKVSVKAPGMWRQALEGSSSFFPRKAHLGYGLRHPARGIQGVATWGRTYDLSFMLYSSCRVFCLCVSIVVVVVVMVVFCFFFLIKDKHQEDDEPIIFTLLESMRRQLSFRCRTEYWRIVCKVCLSEALFWSVSFQ